MTDRAGSSLTSLSCIPEGLSVSLLLFLGPGCSVNSPREHLLKTPSDVHAPACVCPVLGHRAGQWSSPSA